MDTRYEDHLSIRAHRLTPFFFNSMRSSTGSPCNWHRNIEIILILSGQGSVRYGAKLIPISAGDAVIVGADAMHQLYADGTMDYDYLIIDESFCQENGIDTSRRRFDECVRDKRISRGVYSVRDAILECAESESPLKIAKARRAALELLILLVEDYSHEPGEEAGASCRAEEYIKVVLEHINRAYTSHISLDELSALANVSKFHLVREFKRYTGHTIMTYINILRCRRAEVAIAEGASVTAAALEAGFESLSYFSRTYKKLTGHTPSVLK